MSTFLIALENVLLTLCYMIPGYLICKGKKALPEHLSGLSGVLVYICSPCMILNALFEQDFTLEHVGNIALFFVISLIAMTLFMLVVKAISGKKAGLLPAAAVMGNVGFFGLPILRAILPDHPQASAFSIAYVLSMNVLAFTVGVYELTNDKKSMSLRAAFINPSMISFAAGCILCLLGFPKVMGEVAGNAVRLVGNMCTPLCLFILGIRLASMPMKRIFCRPQVYIAGVLKLIAYPLFAYALVVFLPIDQTVKAALLVLSAAPCASILLNLAEMQGGDKEMTADCCLLSTMSCFITIPLLTLLLG